jgi:cytoskeletal protein RodZ
MPFQAEVGLNLIIENVAYRIAEHPAAPGLPYGQEGRTAVVYCLDLTPTPRPDGQPPSPLPVGEGRGVPPAAAGGDVRSALKVFKPRYRLPALVSLAQKLQAFADLPGLRVCRRTVLTPQRHAALLRQYPDLTYAVLMPWIEGPTWMEVVLRTEQSPNGFSPERSLILARGLAEILAEMEQRGIAHCDLSGPNVLLPALVPGAEGHTDGRNSVALVDVEQLYGPGLERPAALPVGSPGYAHKNAPDGLWSREADRFAGALLLAEMLGWCDPRVPAAAWGEHFFDPAELQTESDRYRVLVSVLRERWGDTIATLFERAWRSETLADCPTFGEWLLHLPKRPTGVVERTAPSASDSLNLLLARAQRLEKEGDWAGALRCYQDARRATTNPALQEELDQIVAHLEQQRQRQSQWQEQARQAEAQMRAGRWSEAAALYEALLREPAAPPQQQAWQAALDRCREEIELAGLFSAAERAIAEKRWIAAAELLNAIAERRPDYARGASRVRNLQATVARELARQKKQPAARSFGRMFLTGLLTVLVLGAVGLGGWYLYLRWQEDARQRAIAAATAQAAPWLTVTAQAQGTAQALATQQAEATRQAKATQAAIATERAQVTAQAQQTAQALAAERATATAQAQQTATAIAGERATATAQVLATQKAVAQAATATAQAQATARAAAQAQATAQAATAIARSRQRPGLILDFEQELTWRRGDQPYGQLDRSGEQVRAGSYAGRLRYDFPAVNDNFVVFLARPPIGITGQPTGITAWVYGNGSGHFLNAWIQDAAGEVRSYTFGPIQHQGWQQMTAWFDDQRGWPNGHIGGPDDGHLNFPIQFYAFVLDGVPDGQSSSGTIYIDEVFGTTEPIPAPTPPPPPPPPPPATTRSALLPGPPDSIQVVRVGGLLSLGLLIGLELVIDRPLDAIRRRRWHRRR